jgi:hypothetical protein
VTEWSLPALLQTVSSEVERSLSDARRLIGHEGEKGGASEEVWRVLLRRHLPLRYQVDTGFVVDSRGAFSEQIDIIVFDRQYSPLVFELGSRRVFPAESVYAIFEAKQVANARNIKAAQAKACSVKSLFRTNLPVRHLDGSPVQRPLLSILAGFLALESDWTPAFGDPLRRALQTEDQNRFLDIGCVATAGLLAGSSDGIDLRPHSSPATAFVFEFISRLQESGTVPMIDMREYQKHLPVA